MHPSLQPVRPDQVRRRLVQAAKLQLHAVDFRICQGATRVATLISLRRSRCHVLLIAFGSGLIHTRSEYAAVSSALLSFFLGLVQAHNRGASSPCLLLLVALVHPHRLNRAIIA